MITVVKSFRGACFIGFAIIVLAVMVVSASLPTGGGWASEDAVCIMVDEPVVSGIRATGSLLLSPTLQTLDQQPRRVRVLSYWITIGREGCAEKVTFKGTPLVDPATRKLVEGQVRTIPSGNSGEDLSNIPARCQFSIQPCDGRTWGSVTESDHVEIQFEWEPH